MRKGRCSTGHFYDMDSYDVCPHCGSSKTKKNMIDRKENITDEGNPRLTRALFSETSVIRERKKISAEYIRQRDIWNTEDIVGWLIFRSGSLKGSYVGLRARCNTVGVSELMDISISGDEDIYYYEHAFIEYSENLHSFFVRNGNVGAKTYVNGKRVLAPKELESSSVLKFGNTEILFVAIGEQGTEEDFQDCLSGY